VPTSASTQSNPADPTLTTSTTGVMMGLAGAITPKTTGRVQLIVTGVLANSLSGDGAGASLRYGTGGAPANAAAPTGSLCTGGAVTRLIAAANNQQVPETLACTITNLTVGTAYWFDAQLQAITAGNASLSNIIMQANEF
jgi:hypothetical protein